MQGHVLEKLEWPLLVGSLAGNALTDEGKELCLNLNPGLNKAAIEKSWTSISQLKTVLQDGFALPISALSNMRPLLKSIRMGQMLDGIEFRQVFSILEATNKLFAFSDSLKERFPQLRDLRSRLSPLPKLSNAISEAIGENGELLDDASPELKKIRNQKKNLRKKIEEKLTSLIHNSDLVPYLQDDYFTIRADRYVLPLKLDSRGRVEGKIVDTSESGQTLFCEPQGIVQQNDQLMDLELQEKLEIIRIYKSLSQQSKENIEILVMNYESIVAEDVLHAKATHATRLDAVAPTFTTKQCINLIGARHPLLKPEAGDVVANSICTMEDQTILIISGPNAGGKTVILKTVGMLHLMAKAGLLLPVDETSTVYDFDKIYLELGDSQNIQANLSTFSAHLMGLKPILNRAGKKDLVLLDEIAVGTDPQTGSSIAQAILENLAGERVHAIVTTHFDNLKTLAINDKRYRNGSMEYSLKTYKPTYHLIWDLPGQSFGIELAEQMGLPEKIIKRAKELRGTHLSSLDDAITQYLNERVPLF